MIHTIADITGTGATVALSPTPFAVRWILIGGPTANSADLRVGDSSTSATRGVCVGKGTSVMLPAAPETYGAAYAATGVFVYIANGDKATISWGD